MYQDNVNGISVKLILDTRSKNKKGLYPVRVQVIFQRNPKYYNSGKSLTVEEWEKLATTRVPQLVDTRNCVKETFELVLGNVRELASKGDFTFSMLNILLGKECGDTLNSALKAKIRELDETGQIGTKWYYEDVLKSVQKFTAGEVPFKSVTVEWLKKLENHLLQTNLCYSTIGMRMRGIRTMMNVAKKKGLIKESQYPFGKDKYEIRTGKSVKKALTIEQVAKVANFSCTNDEIMFFRDMWMFIYLCNGLNVADLARLKYKNIIDNEICFIRKKTERTSKSVDDIKVAIIPEVREIIDRWGNAPDPDNFIFNTVPYEKDQEAYMKKLAFFTKRLNTTMKFIGSVTGVGKITSYTARHTFATVLKRSGANIAYIQESLGHSDLKTTQHYLASFESDTRMENASLLTQYKKIKQKRAEK